MTAPTGVRQQEEELIALRSIFGDDWRDIPAKKTAWGTRGEEGWWEIVLRARDDERVKVTLRGRFPKLYPAHIPQLSLNDPVNLSADHVKVLNRVLQEQAKAKVGDAMIYDLIEFAQDWISDNHLSLPNPDEVMPTLMEQMAQREQAQKEAEQLKLAAEQNQRLAQAAEQERLLTEKIQLDASRKSERARQAEQEADAKRKLDAVAGLADGELESRTLVLEEDVTVEGYQGSWNRWSLFGGKRASMWTTYLAEPDSPSGSFVRATLPTVAVHVVDFSSSYYSTPQGKKKLDALSHDISRLRDVRCEHVVRILAIKRDTSPKGWERLLIMTENVRDGGRISGWLPPDGFGEALARGYLLQLLDGLSTIHRAKATQKQIDTESVFLSPGKTAGEREIKLCGTSFARRIGDLHLSNPFLKTYTDPTPDLWRSPDELESPHDYTTRRDVWHAALLFLQLIFGPQCLWIYPNLDILLQHSSISDPTVELLRAMMHPNPKKRLSADEAIERLKQKDTSSALSRLDRSASSAAAGILQSPKDLLGTSPTYGRMGSYFPQSSLPRQSRYREDFHELEGLGQGGFGQVVKARNKIDGRTYAIKKIKLREGDDQQRVYREVQNMSGVNHQHIVRYFTCWLEDVQPPNPEPEAEAETASSTGTPSTATAEEPMNFFQPNFNDLSFSRPDHSRSASFPSVRFANDDSDSGSEAEDSSDSGSDSSDAESVATIPDPSSRPRPISKPIPPRPKPSMSITDATSGEQNVRTILYIAMEFVEKQTLKELILAGIPEDEGWILLKQILDALAHLASIKIVHRDLKPSNILINLRNQVKIADFGLSTTDISIVDPTALTGSIGDPQGEVDRTSNIGTGLYIAPEVAVSRSYDEKADMYSLGIIFFEMCFRFDTQMERAQILTTLRLPSITFPPAWTGMADQRKIVSMLLQHEPTKRPTAEQLLRDPLLPNPERDQQKYLDAITEVSNPSSTYYPQLVGALFDPERRYYSSAVDNRLDDYTYDNPHDDELQIWVTVVQHRLVQLFQRHGAVEAHLPLLLPDTTLLSAFRPPGKPAKLLDPSGKLVRLPASNLVRLARNATRRQIERIKRYHVGDRYEAKFEGQPTVHGEVSFDIISPIRSHASEAELLDIIDKMLAEFKGAKSPAFADYELHVSHEGVLATLLGAMPEKHRSDVARIFRDAGPNLSAESKVKLSGLTGIPKPLLDDIEQCCTAMEFDRLKPRLEGIFTSSSSRRRLSPALEELEAILKLARSAGVTRRIMFRPTMSRHADLFRGGFMFECVRRSSSKPSSASASGPYSTSSYNRDVLVYGGRYDTLLNHFRDPAKELSGPNRPVFGVGMSLATDVLARTVKKYESALSGRLMNKDIESERSFGFWTPARCDVYVVAAGLDLAGRMSLTGELWRAGIRADLQYDDERSQLEVERECLEQNTLFLLVPKVNRQSIKIRPILRKGSEVDVPRNDLVTYLRQAIFEQRRIDAAYAAVDPINSAGPVSLGHGHGNEHKGGDADIRLVLHPEPQPTKGGGGTKGKPVRKHRHATKQIYYDKAAEFALRVGTHLPILAIELDVTLISRMTSSTAWINEDEAWRAVLADVPSSQAGGERKYADTVRAAVRESLGGGAAAAGGASTAYGGPPPGGLTAGSAGGVGVGSLGGVAGEGKNVGMGGWMWLVSVREREAKGFLLQAK